MLIKSWLVVVLSACHIKRLYTALQSLLLKTMPHDLTGAMTKLSFSTGGPRWRCCRTGLNVEGICTNATCKAHGRMIIDMKVRAILCC